MNKATLIEKIAELVRDKRIEGIADICATRPTAKACASSSSSSATPWPTSCSTSSTASPPLQTTFGGNMVALNGGRPETAQSARTSSRPSSTSARRWSRRRTRFLLNKARERAHVLVGLAIAVANIDEVIQLIRSAPSPARRASS